MDNIQTPNFIAILTADVRYDNRLTANAKLLYAEITALTNCYGCCYANNNYFAVLYDVDERTIQRWLKLLEKLNYIEKIIEYAADGKTVKSRYLKLGLSATQTVSIVNQNSEFQKRKEKNNEFSTADKAKKPLNQKLSTKINELSTLKQGLSTIKGGGDKNVTRGVMTNLSPPHDKNVMDNILDISKINNTKELINNNSVRACARQLSTDFDITEEKLDAARQIFIDMLSNKDSNSWIATSQIKNDEDLNKRVTLVIDALIKGCCLTHNISLKGITVNSQYFIDMIMGLTWNEIIKLANYYRRAKDVHNPTFYILGLLTANAENEWSNEWKQLEN